MSQTTESQVIDVVDVRIKRLRERLPADLGVRLSANGIIYVYSPVGKVIGGVKGSLSDREYERRLLKLLIKIDSLGWMRPIAPEPIRSKLQLTLEHISGYRRNEIAKELRESWNIEAPKSLLDKIKKYFMLLGTLDVVERLSITPEAYGRYSGSIYTKNKLEIRLNGEDGAPVIDTPEKLLIVENKLSEIQTSLKAKISSAKAIEDGCILIRLADYPYRGLFWRMMYWIQKEDLYIVDISESYLFEAVAAPHLTAMREKKQAEHHKFIKHSTYRTRDLIIELGYLKLDDSIEASNLLTYYKGLDKLVEAANVSRLLANV